MNKNTLKLFQDALGSVVNGKYYGCDDIWE